MFKSGQVVWRPDMGVPCRLPPPLHSGDVQAIRELREGFIPDGCKISFSNSGSIPPSAKEGLNEPTCLSAEVSVVFMIASL